MDDPRIEEILRRLDAMEQMLADRGYAPPYAENRGDDRYPDPRARRELETFEDRRRHEQRGGRRSRGYEGRRERGQPFDERRVVDLIVDLVEERMEDVLSRHEPMWMSALSRDPATSPSSEAPDRPSSK